MSPKAPDPTIFRIFWSRSHPPSWRKGRRSVLYLAASCLFFGSLSPGPAIAQRPQNRGPVPTPTLSSVAQRQQQMEEVYEGYARLFVLGHILSKSFGIPGMVPSSMNLDVFAQQPLLAETGDVFVYRPSPRGDIMWPLVVPTPDYAAEAAPTATPIPIFEETETRATPTPTPSPTPTPVPPPPLKLQIVSLNQKGALAMIGNTLVSLGDTIEGATITQIGKHYVTVEYYGSEFYVTKKGTVAPEDFKEEDLLFR